MVPRRQSPISFMHQQCFCAAGLEALSCSEQAADPCGAEKEVQLAASFLSLGWAKLKFHIQTSLGKRIWNWFPFPKDKCAWIHTVFELFSCVISVRIWNYSLVSELRNESIYEFPIVFWTSKEGGVGVFCFVSFLRRCEYLNLSVSRFWNYWNSKAVKCYYIEKSTWTLHFGEL